MDWEREREREKVREREREREVDRMREKGESGKVGKWRHWGFEWKWVSEWESEGLREIIE